MMDKLVETKQHMHGTAHTTTKNAHFHTTEHQIQCMHIFCGHINHVSNINQWKKKKQIYKYRKHDNRWILCGYAHYSVHSCSRLHSFSCWTQCISICYHEPRVHLFFVSIFRFIIVIGIISSHRAAIRLILIIFVWMMSMQRIGKIQAIKKTLIMQQKQKWEKSVDTR